MADLPNNRVAATIDQLAWIRGAWRGTHGTDRIEEHWSAADGSAMMGMFRAVAENGPRFYELLVIDVDGDGLVFRLRHFDPSLNGWEEKDEPLVFDLVEVAPERAVFLLRSTRRWMTYRHDAGDRLAVYFTNGDGGVKSEDEYRFQHG